MSAWLRTPVCVINWGGIWTWRDLAYHRLRRGRELFCAHLPLRACARVVRRPCSKTWLSRSATQCADGLHPRSSRKERWYRWPSLGPPVSGTEHQAARRRQASHTTSGCGHNAANPNPRSAVTDCQEVRQSHVERSCVEGLDFRPAPRNLAGLAWRCCSLNRVDWCVPGHHTTSGFSPWYTAKYLISPSGYRQHSRLASRRYDDAFCTFWRIQNGQRNRNDR